ncbi:MAG TPA: FtsX-like permease family protein [Acidimicrobiales bacterium]
MRLARLLGVRRLRLRPLRAALAVLAVAAGGAMAVSVLVVRTSTASSVEAYGRALSGPADLRVVGPVRRGGLEPGVTRAVAGTEGVAAAVPVVQAVSLAAPGGDGPGRTGGGTTREGGGGGERPVTVLGVDCRAEALVGDLGCTPALVTDRGDRPLAIGPGLEPAARVRTQGGSVTLDGVPVVDALGGVGGGRVVVFGLATAQRLFERGDRIDAVYVAVEAGAGVEAVRARLAARVGQQNDVLGAGDGPPEVAAALGDVLPMFTLIAVLALGIGGMLVHNTAALSVEERRLDLAIVAALGGSPRTVAAVVLTEAAAVGALGGLAGAAAGAAVAAPIVASLSTYTERRAGIPLDVHLTWPALAAAVVLGVAVSVGAAWWPVRRALRADVAAELAQRGRRSEAGAPALVQRAGLWAAGTAAGLVAIEAGTRDGGIEPWQVPAGGLGFAGTTLTLVMVGASLAPLALGPLARLAGRSPAGRLAVANLRREPRRTGVMVVAVGAASTTAFLTASYLSGAREAITRNLVGNLDGVQVTVVGEGANAGLDTGMSPELLAALDAVPGARPVVRRGAEVLTGTRPGDLVLVSAFQDPWLDRSAVRGTIDGEAFARGGAWINTALARDRGLRPGDVVRLAAPGGVVDVPVQAVVAEGSTPAVQVPWELYTEHYEVPPPRGVVVEPEPGTSLPALERAIADRVARVDGGGLPDTRVEVLSPREVADRSARSVARELAPFWALQRGLTAVAFVAVLSTLLLVGVQRRREMAILGAVGSEPATLARVVLAEAALVAVLAVGLSATGGLVMLWALHRVAPLLIGWATPLTPDWWSLLAWGAVSLGVALAAALWPARRAAATEVAPALQAE